MTSKPPQFRFTRGSPEQALRVFHNDAQVRAAYKALCADNTPYNLHQLHTALSAAGVTNRPDRMRIIDLMRHSAHFKEHKDD